MNFIYNNGAGQSSYHPQMAYQQQQQPQQQQPGSWNPSIQQQTSSPFQSMRQMTEMNDMQTNSPLHQGQMGHGYHSLGSSGNITSSSSSPQSTPSPSVVRQTSTPKLPTFHGAVPMQQQQPVMMSSGDSSSSNGVVQSAAPEPGSPAAILEEIANYSIKQKEYLERIRQSQKPVMMNPQKEGYDMLTREHQTLREHITREINAIQNLQHSLILPPAENNRSHHLLSELRIQQTQLELFHQELIQLTQPHPTRCIATLVITDQSFPMVITKNKQLDDDPITVQLLSGANVEFQNFSKMKVIMIYDSHGAKGSAGSGAPAKPIETDTQPIDTFRRTAKWHLKFLNGTRKNSATLRFGIQAQVVQGPNTATVTVESQSSMPFIVITNECQWEESEGVLLKRDTFSELSEVSWPYFANTLQRHFLRATRQDPVHPTRCLSQTDFEYIHQKFFDGAPVISTKSYDNFWAWFGKTIKKLRYQRHILPLWQTGLIHGFLSREAVYELLKNQENGTFLVRFSERHPGMFAMGYRIDDEVSPQDRVRHYLVRPDDTPGNKKTLPDFLADQGSLRVLLGIVTTEDGTSNTFDQPTYRLYQKDTVLETYYSKRSVVSSASGYDENIIRGAATTSYVEMESDIIDAE
eukprot:TRINITY_DN771_c0_g2_i2.p1 TRINITY_DN771_c0_g2~~TRINITY_DN771_c0_g2_i2.p1  ORF type:complete len:726 (-),score=340.17 TRINITY_DN771_c0_g2_i2:336-2240(-)